MSITGSSSLQNVANPAAHLKATFTMTLSNICPETINATYQFAGGSPFTTPPSFGQSPVSRLDIDISGQTTNPGDSVAIVITLTDSLAYFDKSVDSSGLLQSILRGSTGNSSTLCNLTALKTNSAGYPTSVQFFYVRGGGMGPTTCSYELVVWMEDSTNNAYATRVILDPMIRNDG